MDKILDIELDADYLSSTTWLYSKLLHMVEITPLFSLLFDKLDEVERSFNNMIKTNTFEDATVFNKTTLLTQIEGLKQLKISLLTLYNCYCMVLKNPQIKDYLVKWLNYKKKLLHKINQKYNLNVEDYSENILSQINKL